jgi:hypothetical protein
MDEGNSGIAVRKWRKYIKRGADDFWDSHGIYLHRSGSYLSFFGTSFPSAHSSPHALLLILTFMTLLLHPSFLICHWAFFL